MPSGAIWTGVSGLDNHQTWMDTIGNNIANSNTAGYKSSRFEFEDILAQSLQGAAPPAQGGVGGTNPEQVGLGTTTGSVDTITSQGSLQQTNVPTDVAIIGGGYFPVSDGTNTHYTRDSVFHVDAAGDLVSSANGLHLRGYGPNATLTGVNPAGLVNLTIPQTTGPASATTALDMFGNLDSRATTPQTETIQAIDSLGQTHSVTLTFTPNGTAGQFNVTAASPDIAGGTIGVTAGGTISFGTNGQLNGATTITLNTNGNAWLIPSTVTSAGVGTASNAATGQAINLTLNDAQVGALTSFATSSAVSSQGAPANPAGVGSPAGFLKAFTITPNGTILGQYTSGNTATLGQMVLATFTNPAGLQRIGQNDWDVSADSGQANINTPGSGPSGTVAQGNIETSNVDLADQLAGMILAERGFQANSKIITTSDQMLQDVVAMKQ